MHRSRRSMVFALTALFTASVPLLAVSGTPTPASLEAVSRLDMQQFKDTVDSLASFGDRSQFGSGSTSYTQAAAWVESQLAAAGYTVDHDPYAYQGHARTSIFVTKIGTVNPDQMYIVSGHLDGRGGGGAADDDGSGSALVLQAAKILGSTDFETDTSIRFIFWNNEETGLNGSTEYVNDRSSLQGVENPPGSGEYPEPTWLGIIQHDMILFDHGLPPQANQIPGADIDIEYQASATFDTEGLALANELNTGNASYSTDYPAEIGSNMRNTDSWPFRNHTAAVSVRENQRIAEIGNGSNPHWHQPTDVMSTYSDDDFRLGFNSLQMTVGTVAELAGVQLVSTSVPDDRVSARIALRALPNPFSKSATINWNQPESGPVYIGVFDVHGRDIRTVVEGMRSQGEQTVRWNGLDREGAVVPSGVYFIKAVTPLGETVTRITFLR